MPDVVPMSKPKKAYQSPSQLESDREWCAKNGYTVIREYTDDGLLGSIAKNRPGFMDMISDIENKIIKPDIVIVWTYSRFSRNRRDSIVYKSILEINKVEFISITEPMPDDDIFSVLLEAIIEALDEVQVRRTRKDTVRQMNQNAKRGYWNGGNPPLGFNLTKIMVNGKERSILEINQVEAIWVRKIFTDYANQKRLADIAAELNQMGARTKAGKEFTTTSLYSILINPIYIGKLVWNRYAKSGSKLKEESKWIYADRTIEAIVPMELFNTVQAILAERKRTNQRNRNNTYWLSGLIICEHCGKPLAGHSIKRKQLKTGYYNCETCKYYLRQDKVEEIVMESVKTTLLSKAYIKSLQNFLQSFTENHTVSIKQYDKELLQVEKKIGNIRIAIEDGMYSRELKDRMEELELQKQTIIEEIESIQQTKEKLTYGEDEIREQLASLREDLDDEDLAVRKNTAKIIISRIEANREKRA
jgi:DNA invertase Pin-like site-specific DNA recombinase